MGLFDFLFKKNQTKKTNTEKIENKNNQTLIKTVKKEEPEKVIEIDDSIIKNIEYKWETSEQIIDDLLKISNAENGKNLKLIEYIVNLIDSEKIELPILPSIATKIISLSYNTKAVFDDYANVVKSDSSIALKVIELANSTYYRGLKDVTDLNIAISRIGIEGLKQLIIALSMQSKVFNHPFYKKDVEEIWKNSLFTSLTAASLAQYLKQNISEAYTTALVNDIGYMVIYNSINGFKSFYKTQEWPDSFFVKRICVSFHQKLSAFALNSWNFQMEQIDAVRNHHSIPAQNSSILTKIIYISNQITLLAKQFSYIELNYDKLIKLSQFEITSEKINEIVLKTKKEFDNLSQILK